MTGPAIVGPSIPITRPLLGEAEIAALRGPLESGWLVQGPEVAAFEAAFARYTGARHALASTSCTTALHLAVTALGLRPGDEVIVPAFTWVSTANVVEYQGARPVFADIDLATFNVDPAAVRAAVTDRTVGIIPVHLFGRAADMDPLLDLAARRGLWVVEDAACGFGATWRGRHVGTLGDAGAFSFHPRKSITTGEGGMLTTDDDRLADLVVSLRDHGSTRTDLDRHSGSGGSLLPEYPRLGFNYRMTDIQGALGRVQLARAVEILDGRRRAAHAYGRLLAGLDWLGLPDEPAGDRHGWQAYVALFQPDEPSFGQHRRLQARRNAIMTELEREGIATRQGTHAPVLQPFYAQKYGLRPEDFPNATIADALSLALPLFPHITDEELERVARSLRAAFAGQMAGREPPGG
jgi:dTDP-4-amino-4,6-dideoxygalactose transaminase